MFEAEDVQTFMPDGAEGLIKRFQDQFNREKTRGQVLERLRPQLSKVMMPQNMGDPAYEFGALESRMVDAVMDEDMVAFKVRLPVAMDYVQEGANHPLVSKPKTYREKLAKAAKIELPETVEQDFYVIAPKNKIAATLQMMVAMTRQTIANDGDFVSRHPMHLHETVAYHALSEEDQEKFTHYPADIAWFEMNEHVLITVDQTIYDKMIQGFDAEIASSDAKLTTKIAKELDKAQSANSPAPKKAPKKSKKAKQKPKG